MRIARVVRSRTPVRRRRGVRVVVGVVLAAVIVAAVLVATCLEVPQIAWLALLAAALVLLDVALGLGIRQWLRGLSGWPSLQRGTALPGSRVGIDALLLTNSRSHAPSVHPG